MLWLLKAFHIRRIGIGRCNNFSCTFNAKMQRQYRIRNKLPVCINNFCSNITEIIAAGMYSIAVCSEPYSAWPSCCLQYYRINGTPFCSAMALSTPGSINNIECSSKFRLRRNILFPNGFTIQLQVAQQDMWCTHAPASSCLHHPEKYKNALHRANPRHLLLLCVLQE